MRGLRITAIGFILSLQLLGGHGHSSLFSSSDPELDPSGSDFSQFPGHLKQFASHSPRVKVHETNGFLDTPQSFFERYVTSKRPALFKKIKKELYGNTNFNPKLQALKTSGRSIISFLKSKDGSTTSLYDYLSKAEEQTQPIVSFMPGPIKMEMELPSIFKDSHVIQRFTRTGYVISNATTVFPLRTNKDNMLVCQVEGAKEVLLIDKENNFPGFDDFFQRISDKYAESPEDTIDYEKVDYEEFPELLEIQKFYISKVEPGSCLFIPSNWIYQSTSIEFDHSFELHFANVDGFSEGSKDNRKLPNVMTLYDLAWPEEGISERPPVKSMDLYRISTDKFIHVLDNYVLKKQEEGGMDGFLATLKDDKKLVEYRVNKWTEELLDEVSELFALMDIDGDSELSLLDFHGIEEDSLDHLRDEVFHLSINIAEIAYDLKVDSMGPVEGGNPTMDIELFIRSEEAENKRKYLERIQDGHTRLNIKDEL